MFKYLKPAPGLWDRLFTGLIWIGFANLVFGYFVWTPRIEELRNKSIEKGIAFYDENHEFKYKENVHVIEIKSKSERVEK